MVDRTHRELTDDEVSRIAGMYHLWRGEESVRPEHVEGRTEYADIPGFCKSATLDEFASTVTFSRPGATLAPRRRKTTASCLKRR